MQDRIPLYPGRVMLTPVPGQENTFDMVRADSPTQEGTPLNKANILKDATAAMFGLGSDAVPDDVLVWIGNYNQHWWKRLDPVVHDYYSYVSSTLGESYVSTIKPTVESPVSISSSYAKNEYGEMILLEPITVWDGTTNPGYNYARGKYVKLQNGIVWKADEASADIRSYTSGSDTLYQLNVYEGAIKYTPTITAQTDYQFNGTYVHSSDRSTYPDSGISGDYKYYYLGIPFENVVDLGQFDIGTYIGTGYSSGGVTLNFTKVPNIGVLIFGGQSSSYIGFAFLPIGKTSAGSVVNGSGNGLTIEWKSGNTCVNFTYGSTYPERGLNASGHVYTYLAF